MALKATEAVEPLLKLLQTKKISSHPYNLSPINSRNTIYASDIIYALGEIGDSRAIVPLVEMLKNESSDPRLNESVIDALKKFKQPEFLETIEKAQIKLFSAEIESSSPYFSDSEKEDILLLSKTDYPETLQFLAYFFTRFNGGYDDKGLMESIARFEGARGTESFPFLIEQLDLPFKDDESDKLKRVINILGKIKDPRAVPVLIPFLKSSKHAVQVEVISALGEIGDLSPQDELLNFLNDPNSSGLIFEKTVEALAKMKAESAVMPMIKILKENMDHYKNDKDSQYDKPRIQFDFAQDLMAALGEIRDMRAFPMLEELAALEDFKLASGAASALGKLGDRRATPIIVKLLNDSFTLIEGVNANSQLYSNERVKLVEALSELKDPAGQDVLVELLNSDKESVVKGAVNALENIATPGSHFFASLALGKEPNLANSENLIALSRKAISHEREDIREKARNILISENNFRARDWLRMRLAAHPFVMTFVGILASLFSFIALKHFIAAGILAMGRLQLKLAEPGLRFLLAGKFNWIMKDSLIINFYQRQAAKILGGYGEKLSQKSVVALLEMLRESMPKRYGGWEAWEALKIELIRAVGAIRSVEAETLLIEAISEKQGASQMNLEVATALEKQKTPRALFYVALFKKDIESATQINGAANYAKEALSSSNLNFRAAAVEVISALKDDSAIPELIKLLEDKSPQLNLAVIQAMEEMNASAAVPSIVSLLASNDQMVRDAAVKALKVIEWSNDPTIILRLLILSSDHSSGSESVRVASDSILKDIFEKNEQIIIAEKEWLELLSKYKFRQIAHIIKNYPHLITPGVGWLRELLKLNKKILSEAALRGAGYEVGVYDAIDPYLKKFVFQTKEETPEQALSNIYSFLSITHDNITLVLKAFYNMGVPSTVFLPLRDVLPSNNPLTRIIRMFGEGKDIVGGALSVTNALQTAGKFHYLLDLTIAIARKRSRAAPQEVSGVLEMLGSSGKIENWGAQEWSDFKGQIDRYYAAGFKVISFTIFKYFIAHEHEPQIVAELKRDVEESLGNIAWGTFKGFTDDFMRKYSLTSKDEMALLGKYMPMYNDTAKRYENIYEKIKAVLQSRGAAWTEEVDPGLRSLYKLGGSRSTVVYDAQGTVRRDNREAFHQSLRGLIPKKLEEKSEEIVLRNLFDTSSTALQQLRQALIQITMKEGGLAATNLSQTPSDEASIQGWLQKWSTLFKDTFKLHVLTRLEKVIMQKVEEMNVVELEGALADIQKALTVGMDELKFNVDKDMVKILSGDKLSKSERIQKMEDLFLRKWMVRIKTSSLQNDLLFQRWLDEGVTAFSVKLHSKIIRDRGDSFFELKDLDKILREALVSARAQRLTSSATPSKIKENRSVLKAHVIQKISQIFLPEIEGVEAELDLFSIIETETQEPFYVGFFDDLLHLMGFMLSGVCTAYYRPDQVKNTDYHFGKLAIKNSSGRVAAVSQVQILRTDIQGYARSKSPKGWTVLALPGINLADKELGMDPERAVLALLETAQRLALENGLAAAVIPDSESIYSNRDNVKEVIKALEGKRWLKKEKLVSSTVLSTGEHNYSYSEVYVIDIPQEAFMLSSASVQQRLESEREQAEQLEKGLQMPFADGIGDLVFEKGVSETEARNIHSAIEKAINLMPQSLIGNIRINANIEDVRLMIRPDWTAESSRVHKSDAEIELILGRDVLYRPGKIDQITLRENLAEFLAAFILDDYGILKEVSKANENAYFKIENIKALLNYRSYLEHYYKVIHKFNWEESRKKFEEGSPAEQKSLIARDGEELDGFTESWQKVKQFNLFLNLMDDADPAFLVFNYLHLLSNPEAELDDEAVAALIGDLVSLDTLSQTSFSILRNHIKEFFFHGKVPVKVGDTSVEKNVFDYFDNSERLSEIVETLALVDNENVFYQTARSVLKNILPLSEEQVNLEIESMVDKNIFHAQNRSDKVMDFLRDFLTRRIGGKALKSIMDHFTLERGSNYIPGFKLSSLELDEGVDADDYGFLEYKQTDTNDYKLVFHEPGSEEGMDISDAQSSADSDPDWGHKLFPFPKTNRSESRVVVGDKDAWNQKLQLGSGSDLLFPKNSATKNPGNVREMILQLRRNDKPFTVFLDAADFLSLSKAQKQECLFIALSNKAARIVVYNERGQVKDKELNALLKLERVERTDKDLERAAVAFSRMNTPAIHLSKHILPTQALVGSLHKKVAFFKANGNKSGTLATAILWAVSGGESVHFQGVKNENGFWTVADSLLNELQRVYENNFVFALAA